MINKEKIITLIGEIRKTLAILIAYSNVNESDLLSHPEKMGNLKYQFIIAIEACIDICNHINAKVFSQSPESYSHCFELLFEKNILSEQTTAGMGNIAKFRNLLVHLYWQVDDRSVIETLKKDLYFFESFMKEIIIYTKID